MDEWALLRDDDGGPEAYEAIVREHYQPAFHFARQILGDEQKAEDVVQRAFVNIYVTRERHEARALFRTFLFRVVTNLSINELNRRAGPALISDILPEDGERAAATFVDASSPRPEAGVEAEELGGMIRAGLMKLPPKHRAALYLREYQAMSYAGISEVLEASLSEVKIWIHRGRAALQDILRPYLDRGESIK